MSRKKIVLFALNSSYTHTNPAVRLLKKYYESLFSADALEIKIIECNAGERDLDVINLLCAENADMYGFSVYIWNRTRMLEYARTVKALLDGTKIFLGGPEISYEDEAFFVREPYVSSIICGEGEKGFVKLCEDFLLDIPLERFYRGEPLGDDEFEALGSPYGDDENIDGRLVYIESVRGCPYGCTYCLSGGDNKIRKKSVSATLRELEALRNRGVRTVKFVDRTFNYDAARTHEMLAAIIERNFPFCCHFEMCAYLVDDETIALLEKAPPDKIRLECGVQSVNHETLKAIKRPDMTQKTLEVIERLHRIPNITLHLDLIAGLPHETFQTFALAYNKLFGKCDMLQLGFLKLLHGTAMRNSAEGYVYLNTEPYTVLKTPDMTREQMNILQDIAYLTDKYPNSGAFDNTFDYIKPVDPFAFMNGFRRFILEKDGGTVLNKRLSRRDCYEYLLRYIEKNYDDGVAASCLRMDFLLSENVMPPAFLAPREIEKIDKAASDVAESFIKVRLKIKPAERGLVYVGRFLHLKNKLTVCNRASNEVYVLDK